MTTLTARELEEQLAPAPTPRPAMADPGAWAVIAFSTTSFMLGLYNAQLVDASGAAIVIPMAFIFGGLIQVVVAILEVFRGNLFGAVVFGSYGPFWIIYGLIEERYAGQVAKAGAAVKDQLAVSSALTVFLAMFAILTFFFLIAALKTDLVLVAVFVLLFAALVLLAIGIHSGNTGLEKTSGWLTLVFGVLGWYHGAGGLISSTFGRKVLPVGPLS